jgi:exonuclease VII small subunit
MRSKINYQFLTLLLCISVISISCVDLKKVNDYSSASSKNIKKFEDIGYSFVKACNDRCAFDQLNNLQLIRIGCDCKNEYEADSITFLLYNSIKGYFDGLTKLSNNDLTTYKLDPLTKALKEGTFGEVKINKDEVDAYAKISNILTRTITDQYRRKKISEYIEQANEPIKLLLNAFQFNLVSNLSKRLETKKERLKSYYFDLFDDKQTTSYEKKKIIEELNSTISDVDLKEKQIVSFGKGINIIAEGHQKLFENRKKMNSKEIKDLLSQYSSDIQDIVDQINKLSKEEKS